MGGSLYRFHPDDFRLRGRFGDFEAIEDWPYSYAELEPYYARAEMEIGVSGGAVDLPLLGPRSGPYPLPPLRSNQFAATFDHACAKLGLQPFPTPRAMNSVPYDGRPACAYCDFCAGYGCPTGARGSMRETFIARALASGNCELRANVMVSEILVDVHGRAAGCVYYDAQGRQHRVDGHLVAVSCSAVESARLLLLSRSARFADGVGNDHGCVGRNLQFHTGSGGRGCFDPACDSRTGVTDRNPYVVRSLMDHYFLPPGVTAFPKGGLYRFDFERPGPIRLARRVALNGGERLLWGSALEETLRNRWDQERNLDFEVYHDFIPNDRTFVTLDPEVTDKWGLPVARIHVDEPEHHRSAGRWLVEQGLALLEAMGADRVHDLGIGYRNTVMTAGTCRAGGDARSAVLNEYCGVHGVPNLFVLDGSFMPTSGGAPCTLSIVANSLRTADYVIDRARTADLAL
jgi:choline dehydrogenase-like flavoprotein